MYNKGNCICQMFSRVPQSFHVGLVREKTHSYAVSRKDKSLGETDLQLSLRPFLFFGKNKIGGALLHESKLD